MSYGTMTDIVARCGHTIRVQLCGGMTANLRLRDEYKHARVCLGCQSQGKRPQDFPPRR